MDRHPWSVWRVVGASMAVLLTVAAWGGAARGASPTMALPPGVVNLVRNASFEDGAAGEGSALVPGWTLRYTLHATDKLTPDMIARIDDPKQARTGRRCLRIANVSADYNYDLQPKKLVLEDGQLYEFSFWARGQAGTRVVMWGGKHYDGWAVTPEWRRYSFVVRYQKNPWRTLRIIAIKAGFRQNVAKPELFIDDICVAKVTSGLANTFGPHMVIQRGKPAPIWGWADRAGQQVSVTFNGQTKTTTADAQKRWRVTLDPMPAGGPYTLTVSGTPVLCQDVLIGDVWVCSGQSNMQFGVDKLNGIYEHAPKVIAAADHPQIRLWTAPQQHQELSATPRDVYEPKTPWEAKWMVCTPESIAHGIWGGFSAVGYFFGREIQKTQHVPVGLVMVARGGTAIGAWLSPEAVAHLKDVRLGRPTLAQLLAKRPDAAKKPAANGFNSVSTCYNTLLHPLFPMAVRGVLWYQGAHNGGDAHYAPKLAAMIADWRGRFADPNLPFIITQLCNWQSPKPTHFEWVREAQAKVVHDTPHTALAVTIDLADREGDGNGPRQIHPKDKLDVGRRMALAARAIVYGEKIPYSGPVFRSMKIDGASVRLSFDHTDGGLVAHGKKLVGFTIAGDDRHFVRAEATLDGTTVVVHAATVAKPVAVRYGYASFVHPLCNLYNGAGLPTVPFRTDDWPKQ